MNYDVRYSLKGGQLVHDQRIVPRLMELLNRGNEQSGEMLFFETFQLQSRI